MTDPLGTPDLMLVPVADMDDAVEFYVGALGCELRFRDGDRFAALALGGLTIGLAGAEERKGPAPALGLRVDSIEAATRRLRDAGAALGEVSRSEHELSAAFDDPEGNRFVIYQSLAAGSSKDDAA